MDAQLYSTGTRPLRESMRDLVLKKKKLKMIWVWWHTSSIPALGGGRKADLCKFKASLIYIVSSKIVRATIVASCLKQ